MANLAQDRDWLESQYQDKTSYEIAAMIGMSVSYVLLQLKRLGIPTRKRGRRAGSTNPHTPEWNRKIALSHMKYEDLKDKEWLRRKYEDEELSCRGVADVVGCLCQSVWKALKLHKIPRRPEGLTPEAIAEGVRASAEASRGKPNPEHSERMKGLLVGPRNPNWAGGISFEPYSSDFTKKLKSEIKNRDEHTCRLCGSEEGLVVHHIDYDKEHSDRMNLITLCRSCNSRVNGYRESWEVFFMDIQLAKMKEWR